MSTHTNLMATVEGLGYGATAPRKAIANLLEQKHESFTVEALSEESPSGGRATVFRTIKLTPEAGAACKLAAIYGSQKCSLCRVGHHHHPSVRMQCGAAEEFKAPAVERLISTISAEIPGESIDHRIGLYVVCDS